MEKSLGLISLGLVFAVLLSYSKAFSLDMHTDSPSVALNRGDLKTAYNTILFEADGSKIASNFYRKSKQAKSDPALMVQLDMVAQAYDNSLRKEMNSLTFGTYRQYAADTGLGEAERMRLIMPMIEGASGLRASQKDTLRAFIKSQLASGASPKMKASLLAQASRPSIAMDFPDIWSLCRFPEPVVREAAYRCLCRIVSRHRDRGESRANKTVFDSLKGDTAHPPDLFQVYALTAIGEDYARDYLAATYASDPAKLKAILTHDPDLKHLGLVKAALAIPEGTPEGAEVRDALKYGLKESALVASRLAAGSPSDAVLAEELRQLMKTTSAAVR